MSKLLRPRALRLVEPLRFVRQELKPPRAEVPHPRRLTPMGLDDKIKNTAEKVAGAAKEKYGDLTDDEEKQAEGQVDQSKADLKQSGEHAKDAASDARDAFKP
jgi:uncharacterized protein YjbJ (UPF0337 family)